MLGETKTLGFFHIFHGLSILSFPIIRKYTQHVFQEKYRVSFFFQVYNTVYVNEFSMFPVEHLGKEILHFSMIKADF